MMRRAHVLIGAALLVAVPAYPCGGPGADVVNRPLVPIDDYLRATLYDDGDLYWVLGPEFRFLEPFRIAMPDSVAELYADSYDRVDYSAPDPPDSIRFQFQQRALGPAVSALGRGAFMEAEAAARRVVDDVLDHPATTALAYRDALRTAVELVDVAPRLGSSDAAIAARYFDADSSTRQALRTTAPLPPVLREALAIRSLPRDSAASYADAHPASPRVASLRFVAIQEAMRTGIPDGWATSIRDSVPAARWAQLEQLHDAWLRRFPTHPMADYVRLSRVRLFYFEGDAPRAWNELLAIYPRHRQRVLGEMRYLVRQSVMPPSLDDPRIDWPLRAGLVGEVAVSPEQWNSYWRASEARVSEPWALPMQERLLRRAVELGTAGRPLLTAFPTRAMAPTPLWGKLRLVALLDANDIAGALAQADSVEDEEDVAAIRARLHLLRRDWGRAIASAPAVDASGQYLVRVLAPRSVVDSLAASRAARFVTDARLTAAGRLAAAGDWRAASRMAVGTDAARERLWARTAALASDTSRAGRLAFARWMRDRHGELFFGESTFWLRGLNWRRNALAGDTLPGAREALDPRLGWTANDERTKIATHLRSTTELYYALVAYASWLDGATARTPGLAAVVREADGVYNRLINWDQGNSRFWTEELAESPQARSIRRAGRLLSSRR